MVEGPPIAARIYTGADVTLEDAQHQHGMKVTSQSHKVQFSRIRIQIKKQKLEKIWAICDLMEVTYEDLGNLWALIIDQFILVSYMRN